MIDKTFDIIELVADKKHYYPSSMEKETWMDDNWVKVQDIKIPLGQSRYGGCIIDIPKGFEIPKGMRFAGQLDLKIASQFDPQQRLPKTGQLLFFADIITGIGKVVYCKCRNDELERVIEEHEDNFFSGVLISSFKSNQEKLSDYYKVADEDFGWDDLNSEGKRWDDFEGYKKSKMFGVYIHCQTSAEERIRIMEKEIVLLQIGENGFNDDGVFNVLIKEHDLENRNFENCTLEWAQS